jgi:hypothetical protein
MLDWQRIASKARFRKTLLRALMNNPSFSSEVRKLGTCSAHLAVWEDCGAER